MPKYCPVVGVRFWQKGPAYRNVKNKYFHKILIILFLINHKYCKILKSIEAPTVLRGFMVLVEDFFIKVQYWIILPISFLRHFKQGAQVWRNLLKRLFAEKQI